MKLSPEPASQLLPLPVSAFCRDSPESTAFVTTVDVEMDDAWARPERVGLTNLGQLRRFQTLCDTYGILPTYLVTYECAPRPESMAVLLPILKRGTCEIGHHLHVWTTPPFEEEQIPGVDTAWVHGYQSELPDSLLQEKAACLKEAIEETFGVSPTSHRAGRWGIDARSLIWLSENGFTVDSSVVPYADYSRQVGRRAPGPCYWGFPARPFPWSGIDGESIDLVEAPVTTRAPRISPRVAAALRADCASARHLRRFLRRLCHVGTPLRPLPRSRPGELVRVADLALRHGSPVLNFMLHSSELALHCSPYSADDVKTQAVWRGIDEIFSYVRRRGLMSRTLAEIPAFLGYAAKDTGC